MKIKNKQNIHIIGNGRITLALLKHILERKLFRKIGRIIVWEQQKHDYDVAKKKTSINEDLIGIYAENIGIKNLNVSFKKFQTLNEISFEERSLVVVLTRYNLDKFIYLERNIKFDYLQQFHCEVFFSRIQPFIHDAGRYIKREQMEELGQCITKTKESLELLLKDTKLIETFGHERLYNLPHSALGIKEFALSLKNKSMKNIIIFNLVNEVDTTSYILQKFSCLKNDIIYSPCDNDRMRAVFFLKKHLKENKIPCNDLQLKYMGPHNHLGFIPTETIVINGNRVNTNKNVTWECLISDIMHKTNELGEIIFMYKHSSDEDTAYGLYRAIESFFSQKRNICFRVLRYSSLKDVFVSEEGCFKMGKFVKKCSLEGYLNDDSNYRLMKIYQAQSLLNTKILGSLCALNNC